MTYTNRYNLKFGTDPEIFAAYYKDSPEGKGFNPKLPFVVIPAYVGDENVTMAPIGGDIKHPLYVEGESFKIIGDGAAYEINLKGPCYSPREMWQKIHEAKFAISTLLQSAGYSLYTKPVINFDYTRWYTPQYQDMERYRKSMEFGCDPDLDACNVDWLCKIQDVSTHPFRYGGGHLHLSGDPDITKYPIPFVRLLAIYLGNYGIINSDSLELEKDRAMYYGKPGKYRIQDYPNGEKGVEYRTLSNSWLNYNFDDFEFLFELVNTCLDLLKNKEEGRKKLTEFLDPTIVAITNADKNLSTGILRTLGVL
jgi:hypothetical protein